jgi:hypothetical protein
MLFKRLKLLKTNHLTLLAGWLIMMVAGCTGATPATETLLPSPAPFTATSLPTLMSTPTLAFIPIITQTSDPALQATARAEAENQLNIIQTSFGAPIRVDLPQGWQVANAALPLSEGVDVGLIAVVPTEQIPEITASAPASATEEADATSGSLGFLPFTIYRGPVTGGMGNITVIWGFRNVTTATPLQEGGAQLFLRGDAIRLLNMALIDPGCNVGIDEDREFIVAGEPAIGAYFASADCPPLPDGSPPLDDIRGWFAITQRENVNFAFYTYTEPVEALDGPAQQELQAIVENLEIDFSLLPSATREATSEVLP